MLLNYHPVIRRIPYLQVPQNGKSIFFPDFSRKDQSNFAGTAYTYILWESEQLNLVECKMTNVFFKVYKVHFKIIRCHLHYSVYTTEIWKCSFISMASPVHTNPSQKRSFLKILFKLMEFENTALVFQGGWKTFWKERVSKTMVPR